MNNRSIVARELVEGLSSGGPASKRRGRPRGNQAPRFGRPDVVPKVSASHRDDPGQAAGLMCQGDNYWNDCWWDLTARQKGKANDRQANQTPRRGTGLSLLAVADLLRSPHDQLAKC